MAICNGITVTSDKIISISGEKLISTLTGTKNINELDVSSDKILILTGTKNINELGITTDKLVNLIGTKYLSDLTGTKNVDIISGSSDKTANLSADGACVGFWYILVDTTLFTADNTHVTVDRY